MGIFDYDSNLPGVITEVEAAYSYGYDTSLFGTTDSEVIIGTAFDGPVGQVTPVYSPEHAVYVFGKAYDSEKKEEATLVAGVQDAWDRGCRTIYAVRLGGKDLCKDFNFCIDSKYRLRVSSLFPSNLGKQVYLKYDNTVGAESLRFYKPASRATIAEKKQGLVSSANAVLSTELRLNADYGLSRDSKLVEVIRLLNEHIYNNVLKLSIVDSEGTDVTNSEEAYEIPLGVLHPGVYFIGRNKTTCTERTELKFNLVSSASSAKPYSNFEDPYFRKLVINTDVTQPLPIFAQNLSDLRAILRESGIAMVKAWDFLSTAEMSDRAFVPNSEDYEESKMEAFEMYKRLGCGFAITAKAESRGTDVNGKELTPRVKETPMDDKNRIVAIEDGLYAMLQDAEIKYRVLTCASADQKITSKLPRAKDFKKTMAKEILVLNDYVQMTPVIDENDRTDAKEYNIVFQELDDVATDNIDDIYTGEVFPVIPAATKEELESSTVLKGTMAMMMNATTGEGQLARVGDSAIELIDGAGLIGKTYIVEGNLYTGAASGGSVTFTKTAVTPSSKGLATYKSKEYVLGENLDHVFVFQVTDNATTTLVPLGDLKTMISGEEAAAVVYAESMNFKANDVLVKSTMFDNLTVEELVDAVNEHEVLGKLFKAELTEAGSEVKDEMVHSVCATALAGKIFHLPQDREISYDFSTYIPYRTTDNFARQLAQHCTYTELKTTPTWGFIGCNRMLDTSLTSVSKRVSELLETEFDLYAKNSVGRNMLDRNNYPFPIGKNVAITFGQYTVTMSDDDYRFISNGAAGYAGMVSTLPLDQSSTSQTIAIDATHFNLTQYQLTKLTKKGIVTFRRSFSKGIVVTDGITMAPVDQVFRRLSACRIVGSIEDLIRQAAEPFIGKQNHAANRNSLHTAIKSRLDKLVGTLIEEYKFELVVDPKVMKFAYIDINYEIVPIYEIREVRNKISVKETLS